ncbi:NAD(P)/FAD-dependent oxidoreductase [Streptomyces pristinaespiralis]|uniref:FAD-dependent pyridine nucleotide-disulfide oxidoreductase n=2 Tax=Streptomyces pristinaespiralis TaxID=38300 RepID=B5HK08_STRE2|nr:FAD-dependent oxidoreductase [Streptomyces pristinaespiralis]ALC19803.1 pyridine nucleotide-disulfide oxidoreductase [Streptomyces pristinaespiralis]EDY67169.1 FAD-dependent pyridine nucleotide-disulfide oxidoreductase [Streptomyces pristinaespiralis ATCC 25486]QMU17225.1 FAD-dependent oxidoreductase [Streptomyces pristinaespiralis]
MTGNTDVVVIGGGYSGVMAANRLSLRDDVTVTLINPRATFVERIRLHQLVGGSHEAVVDYREVLAERVRLVVDTVARIDAAGRSVALTGGDTVGYDYLVYAVGSGSADPGVPGAAEFAYPLASLEEAQRLRAVVDAAPASAAVTVVGAGPTGIETAAELAEEGRAVTLVCGGVLGPYLHPRGRRSVAERMAELGVTVLDGPGTKVTAVTRHAVRLEDGRELPSNVTVWTAGFGVPDLAARSGLSTDSLGRLLTDETLTSVDDARIVAAGDSAAPSDLPLRMSCQAAMPLGARAADTVLSRMAGEQPQTLNQAFAGQCISLGRRAGIFQFAHRHDVALWFHIDGRPGAKLKEFVCKGIIKHLADEAHKPGSYGLHRISGGAKRRQLLEARRGEAPATAESAA